MRYTLISPLTRRSARKIGKEVADRMVDDLTLKDLKHCASDDVDENDNDYYHHIGKVMDDISGYCWADVFHYARKSIRKQTRGL